MKRFTFLFILAAFLISSCNLPKLREIKFKPEMRLVADRYKNELKPEIFQTNPSWIKFDTIVTHKVVVSILNAENLPDSDTSLLTLARKIAKDIYDQIINKSDFSRIDIIFQKKVGVGVANMQLKRNYSFTYDELEK